MAFRDFSSSQQSVQLLQRSLERGRLAHAYLFSGNELGGLESVAQSLAKTLNCERPLRKNGEAVDCCDQCLACQKINHGNHPDVYWIRPESKSRIITVAQVRELMREIQLKPSESKTKLAVIVAADRLRLEGANAFLKTLEEPPADSTLVLLTTEPQRILETILSRCLRLSFGNGKPQAVGPRSAGMARHLSSTLAGAEQKSLISRYRLLDALLKKLGAMRAHIEETLTARSPIQQHQEVEKNLLERWEDELTAAIEAEYRFHRTELLGILQWWLRDVWLRTLNGVAIRASGKGSKTPPLSGATAPLDESLLSFPELAATNQVAQRLSAAEAQENLHILDQLQRWLAGNVQEALALEVGLLKLHF